MPDPDLLTINLQHLKNLVTLLRHAKHLLGPPIMHHPEKVDLAIAKITHVAEQLTEDIMQGEAPIVLRSEDQHSDTLRAGP